MELHVTRRAPSARHLRRVLADSGWDNMHLVTCVGEVLAQREVRRAFDKAPHVSVAGAAAAAMFHERLLADLVFFRDDMAALRITDVLPK